VASSRSPRTRSSPTPSATARSSSTASRWVTPAARAVGSRGAASPAARAATRASAAARRPAGRRASPWRSATSSTRASRRARGHGMARRLLQGPICEWAEPAMPVRPPEGGAPICGRV
jgi:hypothetical protein